MDESKAGKEREDSAQNDTAISDVSSNSYDSLGEAEAAFLDSWEDLSLLHSETSLLYLTDEEVNSPGIKMLIDSEALNESQISHDPPPKVNRRWENGDGGSFSDEDSPPDEKVNKEATQILPLRNYQRELSENAINGLNTIICAPTGSGKTRVATHIILNHLEKSAENEIKPKVAFLARTVPLVMQQHEILSKFLGIKDYMYVVSSLTGDSEFSMHLDKLLPRTDVIVMTPRILENHLRKGLLPHLGVFSMLVFDECHHTRKGEPYMALMYSYLKTKKDLETKKDQTVKLPQIVGLTASIGIENAVEDSEAVDVVLQVCGNLDVDCISTVKSHVEELKQRVPVPTELSFNLKERKNNKPVNKIINIMEKLENFAKLHAGELKNKELVKLLKKIPSDKKSQQYGQWAVKVGKLAKRLPHRNLSIIADYMMTYNFALETHDLVQLSNVMDYLENCFDKYPENKSIASEESKLYNSFLGLKFVVQEHMTEDNPNLEQLKEILKEYLIDKGEKSRGIIFVRSRALTQALTSWLNGCREDEIRQLNATVFTGSAASVEQGGMTLKEQEEIISQFRSGKVRLLVATSVGEEGLDIPECNLVLKYNHVGNEVTTVQTRGRSRKEGGMSILLGMDEILNKEEKNIDKAKRMERAIKKVCQMEVPEIQKCNSVYQKNILEKKEREERNESKQKLNKRRKPFNMVCPRCDDEKLVIRCEDIRTILGTHRVVVDRKILSRVKIVPDNFDSYLHDIRVVGSVKCWCPTKDGKPCGYKVGRMTIYNKVPFVVLGIKYFGFDDSEQRKGNSLISYKKWKDCPYAIDEITVEDFKKYLPEQKDVDQTGGQDDSKEKTDSDNNGHEDKENKPLSEHAKLDQATGLSCPTNPNAAGQDNAVDSHSKSNRIQEQNNLKVRAEKALGNNLSMISDDHLSADQKFQTHSSPPPSQPLQISIDSNSESTSKRERPASADSPQRFSGCIGSARNNSEKEEGNEDDRQVKELEQ